MTLNLATFFKIPTLRAPYKKTTKKFGPNFGRSVEQVEVYKYA